ncbi:coiled-coil domain-containing protein [Mycolicibacterium chitae]|uniref:NLP/P60 n=1 Tax=Mycolicibacterium chitae TaxID=1792 RepID=A0A3S4RHT5_MYCCI|nr:glycoside hydrolase [Mycolicibacterium chitae]MCV7104749.1 glycoside hydrolase [Mycolicibacterium chitae]VEG50782.1 NLP/P60 [Mycolicibacterium chitae]
MTWARRSVRRVVCCSAATVLVFSASVASVNADPAADAMAKLEELSQQAVQTREAVTAAQHEADAKLAEQVAAEERHRADAETLAVVNAELQPHQEAANRVAAMTYMSGRTGAMAAVLTAGSPQQLIDRLSLQRAVADITADQLAGLHAARQRAATAAAASEKSAAEARAAAEQATAVRADLQGKWKELLRQIAAAEAQYATLTPQQQAIVDSAPPPEAAPPAPEAPPAPPEDPAILALPGEPPVESNPLLTAARVDLPEVLPVGVASEAGLQPNSIVAARAVSARFPQIAEIGGVRPDSKPWHPSGLAIDIMIPNHNTPEGIALGDAIMAFALENAGRFGLQDVIWRGTYYTPAGPQATGYGHYDHVHITTTPRR